MPPTTQATPARHRIAGRWVHHGGVTDSSRLAAESDLARAVEALRCGRLVAFPTETVYGLGADARSPAALRRLYATKRRPGSHPVIVHLASDTLLPAWARRVPRVAAQLAERFWPGPLTLILPRTPGVPDEVTGGLETVGVRVPSAPLARALLEAFGDGVAAPSANRFGRVSPTTADDVRRELGADADVVLDGGPCPVGVESTIVDCTTESPAIVRLGGIARERLEECVGSAMPVLDRGEVAAPGTLARHYAPDLELVIVAEAALGSVARDHVAQGRRVGVLAAQPPADLCQEVFVIGTPRDADEYAHALYRHLRDAERRGVEVLLAVPPPEVGIGAAVADRLRRAAAAPEAVLPESRL